MKDTIITVFKDLFKSKDVPYHVTLETIINRIKDGKSKELIKRIRAGETDLKNKLPCILFNGTFSERNSKSLIKHSGLMVVDFDKFPDHKTMLTHLELLKTNNHFVLLFISPGGIGIKGVVRVSNKLDKETHPKVFTQFQEDFQYDYWDKANSNVDRVCYDSYDPDIYINYDAEEYSPEIKDKGYYYSERVSLVPITDDDRKIEKIMAWNWSKSFTEGERNAFIFDLAGSFCEYGVSQSSAENYIVNNVIIGDFSEQEAITTIKSAYKKRRSDIKYFEDYTKLDRIKAELKRGKSEVTKKFGIDENTFEQIKLIDEHEEFWIKIQDKKGERIAIDTYKYKNFLERNGFKKYYQNESQKPTWVYIKSNKVVETSLERIKDYVLDYLLQRGELEVWKYCANYHNLFSEKMLSMLDSIELIMLKDKHDKSYLAFDNGILEITKDSVRLITYLDVDGYIWQSQIIRRDFVKSKSMENEYKSFIYNISNGDPMATECVIGYLLSTYKNKTNNKAIILNDEVISENPEGGTGKGLLVQGLRQIRKVSILDGKNFDDKKSFPYQTVSPETQVLVFDDVKKNFDFESKFSLVTEGMTLERKNKDAVKLKVEESPKMVISTNYAIKGEGNSHDRRRYELEISQYYGKHRTPHDEFGRQLFDEWEVEDYQRFDNYMVHCLQMYLTLGLTQQNAKNIKVRKFIAETCIEFYEYISSDNVPYNQRLNKKEWLNKFISDYEDYKHLSSKRFNIWVQKYCNYAGFKYEEGNTQGDRWFLINNTNDRESETTGSNVPF